MQTKRLRIFAGPNGSGKSTIYKNLLDKGDINLGVFVNADNIERSLLVGACLDFTPYGLHLDLTHFCDQFAKSSFYPLSGGEAIVAALTSRYNSLIIDDKTLINSYFAAFITDYVRVAMLDCVDVFSIETVMSHPSKIDFIRLARSKGYRIYLYFVSTLDVDINVSRVEYRETMGGHSVPINKIISRYTKSMENLYEALICSHRAYLFDNSSKLKPTWYVEYDGDCLHIKESTIPLWVDHYLIQKLS